MSHAVPPPPGADDPLVGPDPLDDVRDPADGDPGDRWPPVRRVVGDWWSVGDRLARLRARAGLDGRAVAWVVTAALAALGAAWLLRPTPAPLEETLPLAALDTGPTTAPPSGSPADPSATPGPGVPAPGPPAPVPGASAEELVVHAAGAVERPGVYRLGPASRVDDLVRAAGGLAPDADPSRVNLAAPLADGVRIYVPRRDESQVPAAVGPDGLSPPAGGGPAGTGPPTALVDLNTATEAELDRLPGVGPATAAAIVAHRTAHGPFTAVEDLLDVRGIGEAKLADLRPLVRV